MNYYEKFINKEENEKKLKISIYYKEWYQKNKVELNKRRNKDKINKRGTYKKKEDYIIEKKVFKIQNFILFA